MGLHRPTPFPLPLRVLALALALGALLIGGCAVPQWRVGQTKVPEPLRKPAKQVEAERAAAKLIADRIEEPAELKPVAMILSESLGEPAKPVVSAPTAIKALEAGIRAQQDEIKRLNAKLDGLQGKPIEGTGVNLFGWAGGAGGIALIALAILFPGVVFPIMLWLLRRSRAALQGVVKGVEDFKTEHPTMKPALKVSLEGKMDEAHKVAVSKIKAKL